MKNAYEIRGDVTAIFLKHKGERLETLISTSDLPKVAEFAGTWWIHKGKNTLYVRGSLPSRNGDSKKVRLHRFIMEPEDGYEVDHINRQGLDNRRENLRIVTRQENLQNMGMSSKNTSGVKGVYHIKATNKWEVRVSIKGKLKYIGRFNDFDEAAMVSKGARVVHYPASEERRTFERIMDGLNQ